MKYTYVLALAALISAGSMYAQNGSAGQTAMDTVFLPFQDLMRAVRDERWKLHLYPRVNHTLLFDLVSDPGETVNLAGDAR